jgi:Protein of unknown function (DUF4235)
LDVKVIFAPIGILAGLAAGFAAQKGFERLWAVIDEEDAPEVEERRVSYPKLVAALALEGAIFRLVKGMTDRGARLGFASMTGVWPGQDEDPNT